MSRNQTTGFFGKMPNQPDFVTRRLPRSFREPWDHWLQRVMAESREALQDDWLDIYLTSPVWRFVVSPGACGDSGWAGLMMPSVDRVGRYFPFTIAAPVDPHVPSPVLVCKDFDWFERAEDTARTLLKDQPYSIQDFDREVLALEGPTTRPEYTSHHQGVGRGYTIGFGRLDEICVAQAALTEQLAFAQFKTYSLWWASDGDEAASLAMFEGLPDTTAFLWLLRGDSVQESSDEHAFSQIDADQSQASALSDVVDWADESESP